MRQLAMLEGTARLRVAERRVRDGLSTPHIDAQELPGDPPLRGHGHGPSARPAMTPMASAPSRRPQLLIGVTVIVVVGVLLAFAL